MLASGNTQSRLGRTIRRVCATVSFCSCNKTSEINQLVKMKRLFWLTVLGASDSGLLAMLLFNSVATEYIIVGVKDRGSFMVAREQRKREGGGITISPLRT